MWLSPQRRAHSSSEFERVSRVRMISAPEISFWKDSGLCGCNTSSGRSSQVDTWRGIPENNDLACFKVFKRLSSNEA
eukprot:1193543-Pyramimonas_sp.AAC.1